MIDKMPVDQLYHTVVVVDDAKRMAKNYALFFGIDKWKVMHHTRARLSNVTAYGRGTSRPDFFNIPEGERGAGEYEFIVAEGTNPTNGLTFQLIQPTAGLSIHEEHFVTRGNGVQALCLTVTDNNGIADIREFLAGEGVKVRQSYTIDNAADVYYFDTRKAVGGYYLKVVVPRVENWQEAIKVDETWDFSGEVSRPEQTNAMLKIQGLGHFGVVVHNLMDTVESTSRIFGQTIWRGQNWSSFTGSLMDCTNNGQSVKHAYFTSTGIIGKNANGMDFGFEMIQPTFGPSNYKEDFLLAVGEGIHHVDLRIPFESFEDFVATDFWWREIGAPVCMSGWLNRKNVPFPQFQYQDTRNLLGFVSETHAAHQPTTDGPPKPFMPGIPRYMHDFGTRVEV